MGVTLGGLNVKSRQSGVTTVAGVNNVNETISAVNPAKCTVNMMGFSSNFSANNYAATAMARVVLTNSTTVAVTRDTLVANNTVVSWEVVEFY